MLGFYAREHAPALQFKLVYRGYELAITRAALGWRVGIHPRTADLPILRRCEVFAGDQDEALSVAKGHVDRAHLL